MDASSLAEAKRLFEASQRPLIIQAENPDADSLGSALALEDILTAAGKEPELYCAVDIPKYLNYLAGWDRVSKDLPKEFDLVVLVDASTQVLLEKTLQEHATALSKRPFMVIDHHQGEVDLPLAVTALLAPTAAATGEFLVQLAPEFGWTLTETARYMIAAAIIGDTGNLVYDNTTVTTFETMTKLLRDGLDLGKLHDARRKSYEKSAEILAYKGELLQRIAYASGGSIAHLTIPWEETERYSDKYNPAMLVIDEMLLVDTVKLAVIFKVYPKDHLITAKLRSTVPVAHDIAKKFGGGGHPKAAGCKVKNMEFDAFYQQFMTTADVLIKAQGHEAL